MPERNVVHPRNVSGSCPTELILVLNTYTGKGLVKDTLYLYTKNTLYTYICSVGVKVHSYVNHHN